MFIKAIEKSNKNSPIVYTYYRLMQSYRTTSGPRQRKIIDLGKLEGIDKKDFKKLADLIEDKVKGRQRLFSEDESLEKIAQLYASLIIKNKLMDIQDTEMPEKETTDTKPPTFIEVKLDSIQAIDTKTIGAEYVGLSMLEELGFRDFLSSLNFSKNHIDLAFASIIARLVYPSSEHLTLFWLKNITALDKLLNTSFEHISLNSLYRISDKLLLHKEQIEEYLRKKEKDLFCLNDSIILFDLTNTYFESTTNNSPKLAFGHSKEKRSDCPLITLGLVIDQFGFVKHTEVFKGNIAEPKTLSFILEQIDAKFSYKPTIVMDAGIATASNLELIKDKGFSYICVARSVKKQIEQIMQPDNSPDEIALDENTMAALYKTQDESILYVKSLNREKKEQMMKQKLQRRFEDHLNKLINRLKQNKGSKKYDKVLEQIARLKERYSLIAHYYNIDIKTKGSIVEEVSYTIDQDKLENNFSGVYYLKTNRTDLDEKQIKDTYSLLVRIEASFRSLKSELSIRPNYHQKQSRIEAHIFIATLTYHLLNMIVYKLKQKGINQSFKTTRIKLSTHTLNTTAFATKDNKTLYIRACSLATPYQKEIYKALNLNPIPLSKKIQTI